MVKYLVFCAAIFAASLPAQTLALTNTSDGALDDATYGADFVVGDGLSIEITGAAANASVTLLA